MDNGLDFLNPNEKDEFELPEYNYDYDSWLEQYREKYGYKN